MPKVLVIVFSCLLYAIFNVAGATLIKHRLERMKAEGKTLATAMDFITTLLHPQVILGFGVIFISSIVIIKLLSLEKFSVVVPIAQGFTFLITALVGYWLFQDQFKLPAYVGMVLIVVGIVLVSKYTIA